MMLDFLTTFACSGHDSHPGLGMLELVTHFSLSRCVFSCSMKALIDACVQVTSRPVLPYHYSRAVPSIQESAAAAASDFGHSVGGLLPPVTQGGPLRKRNHDSVAGGEGAAASKRITTGAAPEDTDKREKRLGQNRMAAVESRRRKKHMIEELQRSVQYYSRANSSLKSQNADLERELLLAKHSVLINRSKTVQSKRPGGDTVSAANIAPRNDAAQKLPALKAPTQQVLSSEQQPIMSHGGSLCVPSSIMAYGSKVDMDEQSQQAQAQFAATQALYTSMGYPAGAARFAASTLSQFVGETGIAPVSSAPNVKVAPPEQIAAPIIAQQLIPTQSISADNALKSPSAESKDDMYIDALNRFAMQQAAAANAAAAAATAAIQAAQLHMKLKENGASLTAPDAQSFPFSFPVGGMAWPFQNPAQFPTKE